MADRTARILIGVDVESQTAQAELSAFDAKMDVLTETIESFGSVAELVGSKVAAGHQVQQSEIDALTAKYGEVKGAVEAAFPEGAPAQLTSAMKVAEAQVGSLEGSIKTLPPALDSVKTASNDLPPAVIAAFSRAEAAVRNFEQKLATGARISVGDLNQISTAQTLLNREIEKAGLDLDKMGSEAKAAYAKLQAAQKEAISTARDLKADIGDVRDEVSSSTAGFSGFGNALEQMGGKAGAAAEKLGFITGALAAGIAMGQQFNQFAKTDMTEWQEQAELLGMRFKKLGEVFGELILQQLQFGKALATGDWKLFKATIDDTKESLTKAKDAIVASNDKLREQRDELKNAEENAKKLAAAQKEAEKEAEKFAEAQKKVAEQTAKLNLALTEQRALMETSATDASRNRAQGAENADQLRNTEGNIRRVEGAIDDLRDKLAKQVEDWGADSAAVANTRAELEKYEQQLERLLADQARLSKSLDEHRAAEDAAAAAMKRAEEQAKALEKQKADLTRQVDALNGSTKDEIMLQDHTKISMGEAGKAKVKYRDETVLVTDAKTGEKTITQQLILVTDENTKATEKQTNEQKKAKAVVDETTVALTSLSVVKLDKIGTEVDTLKAKIDALNDAAVTAKKNLTALSNAGGEDADEDDGISIRRSGTDKELGKGDKLAGGFGR